MRKYIQLLFVLICMFGLAGCDRREQQEISVLNYENLVSTAARSDMLSVFKSDDENEYIINGLQLAQFLDTADWTAQTGFTRDVQRETERNSISSVQIKIDDVYLKIFDTDTANIYDENLGKDLYYRMGDRDYEVVLDMVTSS